MDEAIAARLQQAFAHGSGEGLLRLGAGEVGQALPPVFVWWRDFAARYVSALCVQAAGAEDGAAPPEVRPPDEAELGFLVLTAPLMPGAEYLTADILRDLWSALAAALAADLAASGARLQDALKRLNPAWNLVGRVHFNLAENRRDPDAPFAFLATYTTRLSAQARAQHLPLGQALREYAGAANVDSCSRCCCRCSAPPRPAPGCGRWSIAARSSTRCAGRPSEALRLLASAADSKRAGVVVRMPAGWTRRPAAAPAGHRHGRRQGARRGSASTALLDFRVDVTLDGEALSAAEIDAAARRYRRLVLLRGRWVEVDREKLQRMLDQLPRRRDAGRARRPALRRGDAPARRRRPLRKDARRRRRRRLVAGHRRALAGRDAARACARPRPARVDPGAALHGTLRPYQQAGRALAAPALGPRARRAASPTTWGSARRSRCWRCCWCCGERRTGNRGPEPPGRAGVAARQLGGGDRALRAGPAGRDRCTRPRCRPRRSKRFTATDAADSTWSITSYGSLLRAAVAARKRPGAWPSSTRRRRSRTRAPSRPAPSRS